MLQPTPSPDPQPEAQLADELARIPYEPLLPVEKKLITWSLILGVVLLAALLWISSVFFAVPAGSK
jgi:hypothetical protein